MTMQVGMVGSDGIVLASDTKWTLTAQWQAASVRAEFDASKIRINSAKTVAVTCAGHMGAAYNVADAILSDSRLENESDIDVRRQRIKDVGAANSGADKPQCIIAFAYPEPTLFLFEDIAGHGPDALYVPTHVHAGDTINAAIYFPMHYYERVGIDRLKRLAAHTICAAGELNSAYIGGLEIVYCKDGEFHRLTDKENRDFEAQAERWDKEIETFILGCTALS